MDDFYLGRRPRLPSGRPGFPSSARPGFPSIHDNQSRPSSSHTTSSNNTVCSTPQFQNPFESYKRSQAAPPSSSTSSASGSSNYRPLLKTKRATFQLFGEGEGDLDDGHGRTFGSIQRGTFWDRERASSESGQEQEQEEVELSEEEIIARKRALGWRKRQFPLMPDTIAPATSTSVGSDEFAQSSVSVSPLTSSTTQVPPPNRLERTGRTITFQEPFPGSVPCNEALDSGSSSRRSSESHQEEDGRTGFLSRDRRRSSTSLSYFDFDIRGSEDGSETDDDDEEAVEGRPGGMARALTSPLIKFPSRRYGLPSPDCRTGGDFEDEDVTEGDEQEEEEEEGEEHQEGELQRRNSFYRARERSRFFLASRNLSQLAYDSLEEVDFASEDGDDGDDDVGSSKGSCSSCSGSDSGEEDETFVEDIQNAQQRDHPHAPRHDRIAYSPTLLLYRKNHPSSHSISLTLDLKAHSVELLRKLLDVHSMQQAAAEEGVFAREDEENGKVWESEGSKLQPQPQSNADDILHPSYSSYVSTPAPQPNRKDPYSIALTRDLRAHSIELGKRLYRFYLERRSRGEVGGDDEDGAGEEERGWEGLKKEILAESVRGRGGAMVV